MCEAFLIINQYKRFFKNPLSKKKNPAKCARNFAHVSRPISTERKAENAELASYKCWGWVQISLMKGFVEGRAFKYVV